MGQQEKSFRENDVLLNSFLINKTRYRVLLHYHKLVWEKENSKRNKVAVSINDILTVKAWRQRTTCSLPRSFSRGNTPNPNTSEKESHFISIHYAKRLENSRYDCNKWRKSMVTLYNSDLRIVKLWFDTLTSLLNDQNRPRRILLFVNPYGGRKQALNLYEKYARPLFKLVSIDVSCVISQRANQIRDMIMTQSLEQYDAICCVGGDGTFSEVFNGLIFRTMKDLGLDPLRPDHIPKPKLPIGVIPAGSTDTVAYCLHGTTDVRTAVIHVILGQTRGLDLSSVSNSAGLIRLFASVMSYGYLGDVAFESEKFRWMGPKRYDYSGVKKIIANNGYEGELVFQMPEDDVKTQKENIRCYTECETCAESKSNFLTEKTPVNSKRSVAKDHINYILENEKVLDSKGDDVKWKSVRGRFFMISGANISCACSRSPNGFSPYNHLGNGYIDVILVRHTTFLNNIRLLLTLVNRHSDIRTLPFVELHRTQKFYFRAQKPPVDGSSLNGSCQPISVADNKTSQWNCDGEIIHDCDVLISSHCQLIDVFMRGPHQTNDSLNPSLCCGVCGP